MTFGNSFIKTITNYEKESQHYLGKVKLLNNFYEYRLFEINHIVSEKS